MRTAIIILVILTVLLAAVFFLGNRTPQGNPATTFPAVSQQGIVQQITDRFAPRLDPATLDDPRVTNRTLTLRPNEKASISIPPSTTQKLRRIDFTDVSAPTSLTYLDAMRDSQGDAQTQTWVYPTTPDNAKLSASEQGGTLLAICQAPEICSLHFR